jgi:hypothetical protein
MSKHKARKPGDIIRYVINIRTKPKLRAGEILCHNQVAHLAGSGPGINGFRYFICDGGRGHGWKLCPCGWQPGFGKHYAIPAHVAYQRQRIAAGKPLTMYWSSELAVPAGHKRIGRNMIAARDEP